VVSFFPGTTHIDSIFQNSRHIEAEKCCMINKYINQLCFHRTDMCNVNMNSQSKVETLNS